MLLVDQDFKMAVKIRTYDYHYIDVSLGGGLIEAGTLSVDVLGMTSSMRIMLMVY